MAGPTSQSPFPPLPLAEWEETKNTLHLFMQVIGKIRLYTFPKRNHWWHAPLYVSARGLTTRPIPYRGRLLELELDFVDHELAIRVNDGAARTVPLQGKSVGAFTREILSSLADLDLPVTLKKPEPYDLTFATTPFAEDEEHATYQAEPVTRYWRILVQVSSILEEFRGRFLGKSTPPHLFWHHMDLALTRFNGERAPEKPGAGLVEREAYSHEVMSFGFWAGDENVPAPAFYAYAAPTPDGLFEEPIEPAEAGWNKDAGMAILMYDDIREAADPRQKIMDFFESTYQAGARQAAWDIEELTTP